ncbi:MAG: WD40 repeat domain-containing protein [Planctomycetaceae bacterium]
MRPGLCFLINAFCVSVILSGCESNDEVTDSNDEVTARNAPTPVASAPIVIDEPVTSAEQPAPASIPVAAAEGRFPLEPDMLNLSWKELSEYPKLPVVCNFEHSAGQTPFLAFGFSGAKFQSECWNFASGTKVGEISDPGGISTSRSLAPDGKHIAFLDKSRQSIEVWSYETGTRLQTIRIEEGESRVTGFLLPMADRLITGLQRKIGEFKYETTLKLFDVVTGQLLKTVLPVENPPSPSSFAISDGGRYLAYLTPEGMLQVFESASLDKIVSIPIRPPERALSGCAFSPDGKSLACMMSNATETKISVASLIDGQVSEILLAENLSGNAAYLGPAIQWLPDQSGWVLNGQRIVNSQLTRQVWAINFQGSTSGNRRMILQQSIVAAGTLKRSKNGQYEPPELVQATWPKNQIDTSISNLINDDGKASQIDVRVIVNTEKSRFDDSEQTTENVRKTIQDAFDAAGLESPNLHGPLELHAFYSEDPGQKLYRKGITSLLIADPKLGGRSFLSTSARVRFELRASGREEPIWKSELVSDPMVLVIEGTLDEKTVHDSARQHLYQLLRGYSYPFHIDDQLTLPGVSSFDL